MNLPIKPTTRGIYSPIGGQVSTDFKQNGIILFEFLIFSELDMIPPTMGEGVSLNYKSSSRIELSQLGQNLFLFLVI